MENKPITPVTAGLIIGLTSVVLFMAYYFSGLAFQQSWTSWLPAIFLIVLIIVFISMWSNAKSNFVSFGSCFGFGFKAVCISTLIVFFFTLVFVYVTPEYKDQYMQAAKLNMRQNKQMTDDQMQKGIDWVSDHFMLLTLGGSLFVNLIIGAIGALIGSAIAKKKPFDPFTQTNQIVKAQP